MSDISGQESGWNEQVLSDSNLGALLEYEASSMLELRNGPVLRILILYQKAEGNVGQI